MPLQQTSGAASYDAFGGGTPVAAKYIEDFFQTWLRTGTGASATVTTGLNGSINESLVWTKSRSAATDHKLTDNVRGATKALSSNSTAAEVTDSQGLTAFSSTGYTIGTNTNYNNSGATYVDWQFVATPKFFDVVTYTGDGNYSTDTPAPYGRAIAHSLASRPGFIVIKATSTTSEWYVAARQNDTYWIGSNGSGTNAFRLNGTGAGSQNLWSTKPMADASVFYPAQIGAGGSSGTTNDNGVTYVAYLFAHNAGGFGLTGTDNVISCGSYTGTGAAGNAITLGYEPQWLLIKRTDSTSDWAMFNNMMGMTLTDDTYLWANLASIENTYNVLAPTATGFVFQDPYLNASGGTYIYIAIRRGPMKTPTTGTSVFDPETYTGNATARSISGLGFPPDLVFPKIRDNGGGFNGTLTDRLRGVTNYLVANDTAAEATNAQYVTVLGQDGFSLGTGADVNRNTSTFVSWNFRRAPGFFDVVCYTGTGSSSTSFSHNLGVAPELIISKTRSGSTSNWIVTSNFTSTNYLLTALNLTIAGDTFLYTDGASISAQPTSTTLKFTGGVPAVNDSGATYVAYLFASCPGVSKVTNFTGTGSLQTINCGFTGGARLVLIKRTDASGDWYIWDSSRGISSSTDPYLLLNSTAAEVTTTNWVDTTSTGFQVTAASGNNVNINGASYIALAIA